jgi:hypothetical protein
LTLDEFNAAVHELGFAQVQLDRSVYDVLNPKNVAAAYRSAGHAGSGPGGYRDWLASLPPRRGTERPAASASAPARSAAHPASEGEAPVMLFDGADAKQDKAARQSTDAALVAAYQQAGRTLDDLPYTPEFDRMMVTLSEAGQEMTQRSVLHRLQNLRKAGKLPPAGRAASTPPRISEEEESLLRELVVAMTGSLGQRDQLPYDPRFDGLVEAFNQQAGRALSPHDIWRLVAKLAK